MKAYQVTYSEGDPLIVVAESFQDALASAVDGIANEYPDDPIDKGAVLEWIEAVHEIGERVVLGQSAKKAGWQAPAEGE